MADLRDDTARRPQSDLAAEGIPSMSSPRKLGHASSAVTAAISIASKEPFIGLIRIGVSRFSRSWRPRVR
jgi:hypothetical protein